MRSASAAPRAAARGAQRMSRAYLGKRTGGTTKELPMDGNVGFCWMMLMVDDIHMIELVNKIETYTHGIQIVNVMLWKHNL